MAKESFDDVKIDLEVQIQIDQLERQIKKASEFAQQSAKRHFVKVGISIGSAIVRPAQQAVNDLKKPLQQMKRETEKTAEGVAKAAGVMGEKGNKPVDSKMGMPYEALKRETEETSNLIEKRLSEATSLSDDGGDLPFDQIAQKAGAVSKSINDNLSKAISLPNAKNAPFEQVKAEAMRTADTVKGALSEAVNLPDERKNTISEAKSNLPSSKEMNITAPRAPPKGDVGIQKNEQVSGEPQVGSIKVSLQEVREEAFQVGGEIQHGFGGQVESAVGSIGGLLDNLKEKFSSAGQWIKNALSKAFEGVKSVALNAFSAISQAAGLGDLKEFMVQAIVQNGQFAASMNQIKGSLAAAFVPIYNAIMPALNALMTGVATAVKFASGFISGLFGTSYEDSVQSAQGLQKVQTAAAGTGSAAKKAAKQMRELASFDEINLLSNSAQEEGGGESAVSVPAINFDALDTGMTATAEGLAQKFKDALGGAFSSIGEYFQVNLLPNIQNAIALIEPEFLRLGQIMGGIWQDITTLAQPFMEWFGGDFTVFLQTRIDTIGLVVSGLFETFNTVFSSLWNLVLFPFLENFTVTLLPVLTQAATQMQLTFQTAFTAIKDVFLTLWTEGVEPALSQVMSIWTDFTAILKSLWDEYGESTFTKVRDAIDNTKEVFYNAWETYLKPTWDTIMETVDWLWTKHLKPLTERIGEFVMKFIQAALDIYNQFIVPVVKWLQEILGPVFQRIWGLISSVVGTVVGFISDLISALLRQIGGIVDFVAGVFTGDWERAWNGVKDIFGGIVDGVKSVFKGAINLIIDIINDFTGGLNWIPKTLSKVPGFGWAKDWQIPQIPKFAKGGIVDRPTLALIGEAGDEAVIPLENNRRGIPAIAGQLSENTNVGKDEESLSRAVAKGLKQYLGDQLPIPDLVVKYPDGTIQRLALKAISDYQRMHGGALPFAL